MCVNYCRYVLYIPNAEYIQYENFVNTILNTKYFNKNHISTLCKFHNYMWQLKKYMIINKQEKKPFIHYVKKLQLQLEEDFTKIIYLGVNVFFDYLLEIKKNTVMPEVDIDINTLIEHHINYYKYYYKKVCDNPDEICIIDFIVSLKTNSFFDSVSLSEVCKYHNFKWTISGNNNTKGMFSIYDDSDVSSDEN